MLDRGWALRPEPAASLAAATAAPVQAKTATSITTLKSWRRPRPGRLPAAYKDVTSARSGLSLRSYVPHTDAPPSGAGGQDRGGGLRCPRVSPDPGLPGAALFEHRSAETALAEPVGLPALTAKTSLNPGSGASGDGPLRPPSPTCSPWWGPSPSGPGWTEGCGSSATSGTSWWTGA